MGHTYIGKATNAVYKPWKRSLTIGMKDNYSNLFLAASARLPQTDKADCDKRLPNARLAVASARDTLVLPEVS